MTAPEPSSGVAEFGLDLDKAREAVTDLREVYSRLDELRQQAHNMARPVRSAHDAVSMEAFDLLTQIADGGRGSFTAAMSAGMSHVEQLIVQMETDILRQEQLDEASARRIAQT